VRVGKVLDDSIAAKAGLAEGDFIVAAAGTAVAKSAELISIIRRQAPGTWLPLRVKRGGETIGIVAKFPPLP
jgi:S1-C subfamily serine protease